MMRTCRQLAIGLILLAVAGIAQGQPRIPGFGGGPPAPTVTVSAALNATALKAGQDAVLAIVVDVPAGFHAQSHTPLDDNLVKFAVQIDPFDSVNFGQPAYPPGLKETYPKLGTLSVYQGKITVYVPVRVGKPAPGPAKLTGSVTAQLCDDSTCFQPASTAFSLDTRIVAAGESVEAANTELFADYRANAGGSTQPSSRPAGAGRIKPSDTGWSLGFALSTFSLAFVAGILFNVVPCVLPVLPIKVLGFVEVAQHDRAKTLKLAAAFGLGIVAVFVVLAVVVVGMKKLNWGQQYSNPYFAWPMIVLLLAMALWMFGLFNLNLPTGVYNFAPRHDTYLGNAQWGVLTAILSTPCTGPLFVPAMDQASRLPLPMAVMVMVMMGVGMATPYVALSAFPEAARRFPRVGPWPELVKQMMAFVLLAFTVFFAAGRFVPAAGQWWAAVPIIALAAFYLVGRTVQLSKSPRALAISSTIAVAMVSGVLVVALLFSGHLDSPADGAGGSITWTPYSDQTVEAALASNKIVLVEFTATWCLNCQYIEATVYHNAEVIAAIKRHDVVMVRADLTKPDAPGWPRLRALNASGGVPFTAIYLPGQADPVVFNSLYTASSLISTLDRQ